MASANCFELSREQNKDPKEIALKAADKAGKRKKTRVAQVVAENGYVNFFPSKKFFQLALKQAMRKKFGENSELSGKKIIMGPGASQRIKPNDVHRFSGLEDSEILEISTHHDENDSYRIELSGKME